MNEFAEGRLAYLAERPLDANPYNPANVGEKYAHDQWRAGWRMEQRTEQDMRDQGAR